MHHLPAYLRRHAEPDARPLAESFSARQAAPFAQAIVIPVFDEATDFLDKVFARLSIQATRSLVIAVINVHDGASAQAASRTRRLLRKLRDEPAANVLIVDRVEHPLPRRHGVGAARKLGTDIAAALYAAGKVSSPWLYQTDADACLPPNYLQPTMPKAGAVVFDHRHHADCAALQHAADLYDLHMAYYTVALAHCGSRYAYPTLGSTLAVHANDYAKVRGFPRRNAGEDFYLLNKIAKVAPVTVCKTVIVDLQARISERVPFGTGPALGRATQALARDADGTSFLSYDWRCFELLATALDKLRGYAEQPGPLSGPSLPILEDLGFFRVAGAIAGNYSTAELRLRSLTEWFDALKTLRFVHEARRYYPDAPLVSTLRDLPPAVRDALPVPDWM